MIDGHWLIVLAFPTPNRYLMGLSYTKPQNASHIELTDVAHMTYIDGRMSLQPVAFMETFVANTDAYAGYGEADKRGYDVYGSWLEMRKNPPDFEVEDSVS